MKLNQSKYLIKLALVFVALLIVTISLLYTNQLVQKLVEREQKLINLYAKGIENLATAENAEDPSFLFQEIVQANNSVPVILTNDKLEPSSYKNIYFDSTMSQAQIDIALKKMMLEMEKSYRPIAIEYVPGLKNYIYYKNSQLIDELRYYPYIQLSVIFIFVFLGYMVFSNTRRAEQNSVWVGMSKETAHQLATPISSLMAWAELFKSDENFSHPDAIVEIEKDIIRLETITARFSNIGSIPTLKFEKIVPIIENGIHYLRTRVSQKVRFEFHSAPELELVECQINKPLLDWAIENIIKNAVDAMSGAGAIQIEMSVLDGNKVCIEITDNGKGMMKNQIKKIFEPGFTSKQRGWGLGLTLTKRIVEEYHGGKVAVKYSEINKGTCFKITLPIA